MNQLLLEEKKEKPQVEETEDFIGLFKQMSNSERQQIKGIMIGIKLSEMRRE